MRTMCQKYVDFDNMCSYHPGTHPDAAGLLHPAGTVMDLNIGAALWLAAYAEGRLAGSSTTSAMHASIQQSDIDRQVSAALSSVSS